MESIWKTAFPEGLWVFHSGATSLGWVLPCWSS